MAVCRSIRNFAAGLVLPLAGCAGVLDPQGPVGRSEKLILADSVVVMLFIVVPVLAVTLWCAWWYRASNKKAQYRPDWTFSGTLELIVWAIPLLVIVFLGGIAWFGSQVADPFRPLDSKVKPIEVQVVSLDWKWLFIYPQEGIASVNELVIPEGTPVHFTLTSSGVMNSFFVPQLGTQIYTMASMTSQLYLQADHEGRYEGLSTNFSGSGFAGMRFDVRSVNAGDYSAWVAQAKSSAAPLDAANYLTLATPSSNTPVATYKSVDPMLFDAIVRGDLQPPAMKAGVGGHDLAAAPEGKE